MHMIWPCAQLREVMPAITPARPNHAMQSDWGHPVTRVVNHQDLGVGHGKWQSGTPQTSQDVRASCLILPRVVGGSLPHASNHPLANRVAGGSTRTQAPVEACACKQPSRVVGGSLRKQATIQGHGWKLAQASNRPIAHANPLSSTRYPARSH